MVPVNFATSTETVLTLPLTGFHMSSMWRVSEAAILKSRMTCWHGHPHPYWFVLVSPPLFVPELAPVILSIHQCLCSVSRVRYPGVVLVFCVPLFPSRCVCSFPSSVIMCPKGWSRSPWALSPLAYFSCGMLVIKKIREGWGLSR